MHNHNYKNDDKELEHYVKYYNKCNSKINHGEDRVEKRDLYYISKVVQKQMLSNT